MVRVVKSILILSLFLFSSGPVSENALENKISIDLQNITIEESLEQIASMGGFRFSYNPELISIDNVIKYSFENEKISTILSIILGERFEYKIRGSYVIIKELKPEHKDKSDFQLSGQLVDASSGDQIRGATIYEVNKLSTALSQNDGSYNLTVSAREDYALFAISKENYRDTIIQVTKGTSPIVNLQLMPLPPIESPENVAEEEKNFIKAFVNKTARSNAKNVVMIEERLFQVSFLPMLSSNGLLSGKISNNISLNVVAGYTYGLKGVELGGFMNIARRDVKGAQFSGWGNLVVGTTEGFQAAGFMNSNAKSVNGWQMAGFLNLTDEDIVGAQFSGFTNLAVNTTGVQASGFVNYTRRVLNGAQLAGFCNVNLGTMNGLQASGFYNHAGTVRGVQLGVFNYANKVEKGVVIGLLSFVKEGLHKFEIQSNEVTNINLQFKTGTKRLYNIYSYGYNIGKKKYWSYGLGLGTEFNFTDTFYSNFEITGSNIIEKANDEDMSLLNSVSLNFGYRFSKYLSVNAGPVYRIYVADMLNEETQQIGIDIVNRGFYDKTTNGTRVKMWLGYQAAVRF